MRDGDVDCPFCGARAPRGPRRLDPPRLSRGALIAFAAITTACGGSVDSSGDAATDAKVSDGRVDDGSANDAAFDGGLDGGEEEDTGNIAPPYGIPPEDTGPPDEGGSNADYGAPPPPDGG